MNFGHEGPKTKDSATGFQDVLTTIHALRVIFDFEDPKIRSFIVDKMDIYKYSSQDGTTISTVFSHPSLPTPNISTINLTEN